MADQKPDVVVVMGDHQREQFLTDNQPAILIYSGETIENGVLPLPATAPEFWKIARSQYHEAEHPRACPVAADFARYLTASLVDEGFDISHSEKLPRPRGEGHAYGFVQDRLMGDLTVPIVPVMLNTYFPPNQPSPARCFALGQGLATAVWAWPEGPAWCRFCSCFGPGFGCHVCVGARCPGGRLVGRPSTAGA